MGERSDTPLVTEKTPRELQAESLHTRLLEARRVFIEATEEAKVPQRQIQLWLHPLDILDQDLGNLSRASDDTYPVLFADLSQRLEQCQDSLANALSQFYEERSLDYQTVDIGRYNKLTHEFHIGADSIDLKIPGLGEPLYHKEPDRGYVFSYGDGNYNLNFRVLGDTIEFTAHIAPLAPYTQHFPHRGKRRLVGEIKEFIKNVARHYDIVTARTKRIEIEAARGRYINDLVAQLTAEPSPIDRLQTPGSTEVLPNILRILNDPRRKAMKSDPEITVLVAELQALIDQRSANESGSVNGEQQRFSDVVARLEKILKEKYDLNLEEAVTKFPSIDIENQFNALVEYLRKIKGANLPDPEKIFDEPPIVSRLNELRRLYLRNNISGFKRCFTQTRVALGVPYKAIQEIVQADYERMEKKFS